MATNQRYEITISPPQDKETYSRLKAGIHYTIKAEVTPNGVVSLEIYAQAPTFHDINREFSSTVVEKSATAYFYNGRRAAEMKDVMAKGFDQIHKRADYPQSIKNALTTTMVHLEDKFGV
jgi:hypothetical protein